jgi:hypothetical protein
VDGWRSQRVCAPVNPITERIRNIHGFDNRRFLTLDPLADDLGGALNPLAQVGFFPGILQRPDLETAHRVADIGQRQGLRFGQLGDGKQAVQAQTFGELGEAVGKFALLLGGGLGVIGEGGRQQCRGMATFFKGRRGRVRR